MQQNRRGNNGWVGWLIFALVIFGPRVLSPLASWLSQATGLPISTPLLLAAVIGLAVVGSIVGSVAREVGRGRSSGGPGLPTSMPPTMSPPSSAPPPASSPPRPIAAPSPSRPGGTSLRLPSSEQRLPGPPRFEPIIDPRILTFGIVGLLIFGAIFLGILYFAGSLPQP